MSQPSPSPSVAELLRREAVEVVASRLRLAVPSAADTTAIEVIEALNEAGLLPTCMHSASDGDVQVLWTGRTAPSGLTAVPRQDTDTVL